MKKKSSSIVEKKKQGMFLHHKFDMAFLRLLTLYAFYMKKKSSSIVEKK